MECRGAAGSISLDRAGLGRALAADALRPLGDMVEVEAVDRILVDGFHRQQVAPGGEGDFVGQPVKKKQVSVCWQSETCNPIVFACSF